MSGRIVAFVPARMASTRFPGKPLATIAGRSMIEHVYRRAERCAAIAEVVVATCDEEIVRAVENFGGRAVMTSDRHERSTDRIAEAVRGVDADVVLNVQGDEPMVRPEMLGLLCDAMIEEPALECANLMVSLETEADLRDPNQVKVVVDRRFDALYMSREPIPTTRYLGTRVPMWKQLGLIAFTRDFLELYTRLEPTPLEQAESVDMMRAIEHGHRVRMIPTPFASVGVDRPEDVAAVEAALAQDDLLGTY